MPLVNHRHRFVFIHVRKCAGTTVRRVLRPLRSEKVGGKHAPLHTFDPHLLERVAEYYIFAFVRNPWDRALSLFEYYKSGRHPDRLPASADFTSWVRSAFDPEASGEPGSFRRTMRYEDELNDQSSYLPDNVSYVGRVETLARDLEHVCVELGVSERVFRRGRVSLPRKNATRHAKYREVYTDEARACIARHFARDVERFGYAF